MNRTVNLLACLAILVGGVALEAPADDANSAAASKPCCGAGQKTMGKNVAFVNHGEDFTSMMVPESWTVKYALFWAPSFWKDVDGKGEKVSQFSVQGEDCISLIKGERDSESIGQSV